MVVSPNIGVILAFFKEWIKDSVDIPIGSLVV